MSGNELATLQSKSTDLVPSQGKSQSEHRCSSLHLAMSLLRRTLTADLPKGVAEHDNTYFLSDLVAYTVNAPHDRGVLLIFMFVE